MSIVDDTIDGRNPDARRQLTRSERRQLETRNSMLEAVVDLLVETGTPKLSTTDIAERADVAVGTFYNHFLSVEEAIDEVFAHWRPNQEELVRATIAGLDAAAAFGRLVGGFLARLHHAPRVWRAARIAGRTVEPNPGHPLMHYLIDAGVGISFDEEAEIARASELFCRTMTSMIDQFGQHDPSPELPAQAARMLAVLLMNDMDDVEAAVAHAELRYRELIEAPELLTESGPEIRP